MKRNILILLGCLLNMSLLGQTVYVQIGPSFSKLSWNNSMINKDPFNKGIVGVDAMAGVNYLNFKYFCLSSNIGFIQKGGSEKVTMTNNLGDSITTTEETEKLNYLSINTTFDLKIPIKNVIEPYIFVGPRLDYLIKYKENIVFLKQFDDAGKLIKISYGFITGAGINFQIKKIQLGAIFKYYMNLNKLVDYTSDYNVSNKISDNTFTVNFQIGYKF